MSSCAWLPYVCPLRWGICSCLCPFFSFFLTICRFLYSLEISPFKISTLLGKKKSLFSNQICFLLFNFENALYFRYEYFIGYIVYRCFFWGSGLCFHLLFKSLSEREAFNFYEAKFINYSFYGYSFWHQLLTTFHKILDYKDLSFAIFQSFIVLHFTVKSVINWVNFCMSF